MWEKRGKHCDLCSVRAKILPKLLAGTKYGSKSSVMDGRLPPKVEEMSLRGMELIRSLDRYVHV